MVRPGWYPDAANPDESHFYDGERWATDASEPAPPPENDEDLPIFAPRKQRRRGAKIAAVATVACTAAAALIWAVWPADESAAPITVAGRTVRDPTSVLRDGQRTVARLVASDNGSSDESTRCYFARPDPGGDVEQTLRCGPVLFPGGRSPASYLVVPTRATVTGSSVVLTAAREVRPITIAPARVELVRPDGARPPSDGDTDRLRAPRLPAGPSNLATSPSRPGQPQAPRGTTST